MKKNLLFYLLVLLAFTITSCSKVSEDIQRDIVVTDSVFFDIPIITKISDSVTISGLENSTNFEAHLNAPDQGLNLTNLTSVKLKSFNLTLISIEGKVDTLNNFGNLQYVKIQIVDGVRIDSLASVRVPSSAINSSIDLPPVITPETLKTYLIGTTPRFNVIIKAKKATTTLLHVRAISTYSATLSR